MINLFLTFGKTLKNEIHSTNKSSLKVTPLIKTPVKTVQQLWNDVTSEEKKISINERNKYFRTSRATFITPFGGTSNHTSAVETINDFVQIISRLGGNNIDRTIQILLSNDSFFDSINRLLLGPYSEYIEKVEQKEEYLTNLSSTIQRIEEVFRDNLDLFYKSFDVSSLQLDKIRKFIKNLIFVATQDSILTKRLSFKSLSTYYRDRKEDNIPFFKDYDSFCLWIKINPHIPIRSITLNASFGTMIDGVIHFNKKEEEIEYDKVKNLTIVLKEERKKKERKIII